MPAKETLYQIVKEHISQVEGVYIGGEIIDFPEHPRDKFLNERVRFFIGPRQPVEFEEKKLEEIMSKLKIPGVNSFTGTPGWRGIRLASGGSTEAFTFGLINYSEAIRNYADLLDPVACLEQLDREGRLPDLNQFHSKRNLNMYVYPSWDYAHQIYVYHQGLLKGHINPVMETLTHTISRQQFEYMEHFSNPTLRELPEFPQLSGGQTGR